MGNAQLSLMYERELGAWMARRHARRAGGDPGLYPHGAGRAA